MRSTWSGCEGGPACPPRAKRSVRTGSDDGGTWTRSGCCDGRVLVVEVDGALHLLPARWWDDQLRQNEVVLSGRTVLRFPSVVLRCEGSDRGGPVASRAGLTRKSLRSATPGHHSATTSRRTCTMAGVELRNWAGNVDVLDGRAAPADTVEQLQELVAARHACVRSGPAHSFNRVADTPVRWSACANSAARSRSRTTRCRFLPACATANSRRCSRVTARRCTISVRCRTSRSPARARPARTARVSATATLRPRPARSSSWTGAANSSG